MWCTVRAKLGTEATSMHDASETNSLRFLQNVGLAARVWPETPQDRPRHHQFSDGQTGKTERGKNGT